MPSDAQSDNPLDSWHTVAESGTFEERLSCLDEIVSWLEAGQHTLEQAVNAYELGVAIGQRCEETIAGAELRIRQIDVDAAAVAHAVPTAELQADEDDDPPNNDEDFPF